VGRIRVLDPTALAEDETSAQTFDLGRSLEGVTVGLRLDRSWRSYFVVLDTWEPLPGIAGDVERQTEQIFGWLKKVLDAVGADFSHVVKANTYLRRIEDLPRVARVRRKYLPDAGFVGTALAVSGVIGDADLEMEFELINPRWRPV